MANKKMKNSKSKIIFIGTPEFGAIILEKMIKNGYKPGLVITAPDKPVGRKLAITPPPVKVLAKKHKITVLQPGKILDSKSQIQEFNPNLIIVAAYGQFFPKEILEIPTHGCLNVHPSLLPKYRGPSPIPHAILNGDRKTGVTILLIDEKTDHGPIIAQRTLVIEEQETAETLYNKLANLGANLLMEIIPQWIKKMIKPKPQDDARASFTEILTRERGRINWKKTAEDLEKEVRAFYPWPGSYTFWQKISKLVIIKVLKARVYKAPGGIAYPVGKVLVVPQNEIGIQCGKGFLGGAGDFIVIEKLQMEGKKEMAAEDFLRGYPDFVGNILK